tara:strand:+ start:1291 stop:1479 length:189 start_codon:yes stop_codon:yes gene_type:complete
LLLYSIGPLHGLANQEVLNWLIDFKGKYEIGDNVDLAQLEKACWDTLNSGQVRLFSSCKSVE